MMWVLARMLGKLFEAPGVLSVQKGGGDGWIPPNCTKNKEFWMVYTKTLGITQCPYSARTVPVQCPYSARCEFI